MPLIAGSAAVFLIAAGIAVFFFIRGDASAGEVFLVPAASAGPDPFSDTPFAEAPDPTLAQPATEGGAPIPAPPSAGPVQATSGGKPGLYGGTMNSAVCDPGQMVSFLASNPDKAQAWVNALTADPAVRLRDGRPLTTATIPDYVAGLSSFVLLADTRVTNHGYKNGRPNKLQAVLQKGSAVMVDNFGVPRVKCYCGNPLLPAVPSQRQVTYEGPRWPDFDPGRVEVIMPPPTPVNVFVVRDYNDLSRTFEVPPGGVTQTGQPNVAYNDGTGPRGPMGPGSPASNYDPDDCADENCLDPIEEDERIEQGYRQQEPYYPDPQRNIAGSADPEPSPEDPYAFFTPEYYAQTAVDQFNAMQNRGCGLSGSEWHGGYDSHRRWAQGTSTRDRAAQFENRERQLSSCR